MNKARAALLAIGVLYGIGPLGIVAQATAQQSDEVMGVLLGGAVGGAIGSVFGSGSGRDAATGVGALLGAIKGYEGVKAQQEAERRRVNLPRSETSVPHASPFLLRPEGSSIPLQCEVTEQGILCRQLSSSPTPLAERVYQ